MSQSEKNKLFEQLLNKKAIIGGSASINDLREKEFNGGRLTPGEYNALSNFDQYRIKELSEQSTEEGFHQKYMEFQAMANLTPYLNFLDEKFK